MKIEMVDEAKGLKRLNHSKNLSILKYQKIIDQIKLLPKGKILLVSFDDTKEVDQAYYYLYARQRSKELDMIIYKSRATKEIAILKPN